MTGRTTIANLLQGNGMPKVRVELTRGCPHRILRPVAGGRSIAKGISRVQHLRSCVIEEDEVIARQIGVRNVGEVLDSARSLFRHGNELRIEAGVNPLQVCEKPLRIPVSDKVGMSLHIFLFACGKGGKR